ncbi:DUF3999 domain-containing protein [Methyloradius palustris]|uniref:DUF3999 domain-containing protein n=1 Tax=Methyloradius palustris TaxID=2778876 RepID=A0A8E4BV48_9PROT|nr:DUF3999 domain-containing protein [Methyloradius palustris]BCM26273.1 hypothetical protein ZMTM_25320 [Methyloradius palustris]
MSPSKLFLGLLLSGSFWLTSPAVMSATFALSTETNAPLYRTELPLEVYQYTRQDNLSDIVITNAAGEQVPYALLAKSLAHISQAPINKSITLPIFALQADTLDHITVSGAEDLRLQLEKTAGKTTVTISQSSKVRDPKTGSAGMVYLLDAGKKHPDFQKLILDWAQTESKMIAVEVLASDDLNHWNSVGQGILLKTSNAAGSILQNTIKLTSPITRRYIQLHSTNSAQAFTLTRVEAESVAVSNQVPKLLWQTLANPKRMDDAKSGKSTIEFEANGHLPAEFVRVKLPENNTITTAKISVRNKVSEPWRTVISTSVYRMVESNASGQNIEITNPDISIYATVARYWQLEFNNATGGIGAANPTIALGWPMQVIIWNARGNSPFKLQIDESESGEPVIANHLNIENLIPDFKLEKLEQLPFAQIKLQNSQVSATAKTTENTWSTPEDHKRWWLWGGLLLGVLVLVGMVLSLLKSSDYNKTKQ